MTQKTNADRVDRWADDPMLKLVSRWVAIGGIPAIGALSWAAVTWAAGMESRVNALEVSRLTDRAELMETISDIDGRLRQREADAFTEADANLLLGTIQRELDLMNRNFDNLRQDLREQTRSE